MEGFDYEHDDEDDCFGFDGFDAVLHGPDDGAG
jgi:hypothetical protein